ncbi:MAG TPA: ATP-dependent DNA ligase [Candidatus Manganitrophaceae bacterium]|nr:ATP-dependent DNA ligase [Candidatus Manganitrophaceae bacterium]
MQLSRLVELAAALRATSKKTEKIALLADLLKETRERETELAALYLTGALPQGRIGIGWRTIEAALSGDGPSHNPLTLKEVDEAFSQISAERGSGSAGRRGSHLRALFQRAGRDEQPFLADLLIGEMRHGALEGVLLEGIARAADLSPSAVRQAMMFSGNIGAVARIALEEGEPGLARFGLRLFFPIAPMLANSAEEVGEALARLKRAAFEFKLDGARIQLHKGEEEVKIFTRQLQEVTGRLPEVVEWARALPIREVILEGEAIALHPNGRPQPFQITMRRFGRIKNVEAMRREIPLGFFFFDCLYREGEGSLIALPYQNRFELLREVVPAESVIPQILTGDREEAERFLARSLAAGHEGLMAKSLTAPYTAGQRGNHWLKLKTARTLDLVILAVEWGNGRRTGWLSNLHLGARDPESGKFIMLGKTFKGLTDEMLRWQTGKLLTLEVGRDDGIVYVKPELVVEIAYSDIQTSPRYPAGMALRFARVKRYRPDKSAAEADTIETVLAHFKGADGVSSDRKE